MKLTSSTELRQYVADQLGITNPSVRQGIKAIQDWLDREGYTIEHKSDGKDIEPPRNEEWPNKTKQKGTVSFKEVEKPTFDREKTIKSIDRFKVGDSVYMTDNTDKLFGKNGIVVAVAPCAVRVLFKGDKLAIVPNIFLEFYENSTQEYIDKNFPEPKPSAEGEETFKGIKHFIELPKEVSYAPFQKCPVCEGTGKVVDPNFYNQQHLTVQFPNRITCGCCEGSMVIPMKRERL